MISICYRRIEATPEARNLKAVLDFVFCTDASPNSSKKNLLVVIIGPHWLSGIDSKGNRFVDRPTDGVRITIEKALRDNITILPVIIEGGSIPEKDELPDSLANFCDLQFTPLRRGFWKTDMMSFISNLKSIIPSEIIIREEQIPLFDKLVPIAISPEKAEEKLLSLSNWKLKKELVNGKEQEFLIREIKFKSFAAAMKFIQIASVYIDKVDHHPTWENTFNKLTVKLSTHDIGNKVSGKDYDIAEYLDYLFYTSFAS
jgi:pterin-4a-carbinolamine dehydratase